MELPSNVKTRIKQCEKRYGFVREKNSSLWPNSKGVSVRGGYPGIRPLSHQKHVITLKKSIDLNTYIIQECVVYNKLDGKGASTIGVNMDPRIITKLGAFTTTYTHLRKTLDALIYLEQSKDVPYPVWVDQFKPRTDDDDSLINYHHGNYKWGYSWDEVSKAYRDNKLWSEIVLSDSKRILINGWREGGNVAGWYVTEKSHTGEKLTVELIANAVHSM